jgi:hypothetical protein
MKKAFVTFLFISSFASYASCVIHYNRTACPGKEAISYKKCKGQKECDKKKPARTMEQCQVKARKACKNTRFDITKSKIITAKWKGQDIKSAEGDTDFCLKYANVATEFNQCK